MTKTYEVEMSYTCTTTYAGTIEVTAESKEAAEQKALDKVQSNWPQNFESDEDGGDWE